jgi:hypothetical protein
MGKMKDFYIKLLNKNKGCPEQMTIADMVEMQELNMYNWKEYEQLQEKRRISENEKSNGNYENKRD